MAAAKRPRKKKAAPRAADGLTQPRAADDLRRQAEERLDGLSAAAAAAAAASPVPEDVAAIAHELRAHQIELEMQDEELRGAQLELDAQRQKYFELFDLAPVGYLTLNDKGVVGDANLTAAHLLGVERQMLIGQPLSAFLLTADRDAYYLHQRTLQKSREPQTCELRLQRVGGGAGGDAEPAHFWARLESRPRRADDGEPLSSWVTFSDVSETVAAHQALSESEAMRDVSERVARVGSWSWNLATRKASWSPEMYRLFDADQDDFGADSMKLLEARVHPDDLEMLRSVIATVYETGEPIPVEYRVAHRDGSEHILHGEAKTERDDAGGAVTLVGYYEDVTEQRHAEAEIKRLNAELEQRVVTRTAELAAVTTELEAFAYSTSHDLRAPLRAIDGFSLMVMEDAADVLRPEDVRHLERVRAAAQRMGSLIDDLLGLSRLARRDLYREPVDVSALAAEIAAELRAEHEGRVVEVVIAPEMIADADPRLLRVLLRCLLDNAWKFTGNHAAARVEVGVTDADGERAFFVRDDGAGFDMHYAEHLFGAFQRMHTTAEFEGDGIGLAMVQRLVNRHGGTVWAESQVEQGATVFFTLPDGE